MTDSNFLKVYQRDIIDKVLHLHEEGYIHGDLHFGNILWEKRRSPQHALLLTLTDFGRSQSRRDLVTAHGEADGERRFKRLCDRDLAWLIAAHRAYTINLSITPDDETLLVKWMQSDKELTVRYGAAISPKLKVPQPARSGSVATPVTPNLRQRLIQRQSLLSPLKYTPRRGLNRLPVRHLQRIDETPTQPLDSNE